MIQKSKWIFTTNQQTQKDMSRYVKPPTALFNITNITFSLARRICKIVENEDLKEKFFKELKKKNIARTEIPLVAANRSQHIES